MRHPLHKNGWRAMLTLALLSSLVACTDKEKKFRADYAAVDGENRPAIEQLHAKIDKARQAALAKPPLTPAGAWSGPPLTPANGEKPGNAVFMVTKAGVCEESFPKDEPFRFCGANPFCMRRKPHPEIEGDFKRSTPEDFTRILERQRASFQLALQTRYAAFVETLAFQAPKARGDTFLAGVYRAEVRLFDLEGTRYLGGFEVSAKSDNTVGYGGSVGVKSALARDFGDNALAAMNKAISAFTGSPSKLEVGNMLKWD